MAATHLRGHTPLWAHTPRKRRQARQDKRARVLSHYEAKMARFSKVSNEDFLNDFFLNLTFKKRGVYRHSLGTAEHAVHRRAVYILLGTFPFKMSHPQCSTVALQFPDFLLLLFNFLEGSNETISCVLIVTSSWCGTVCISRRLSVWNPGRIPRRICSQRGCGRMGGYSIQRMLSLEILYNSRQSCVGRARLAQLDFQLKWLVLKLRNVRDKDAICGLQLQ